MNVNEFIDKLKEVEKLPSTYVWGTFGNKKQGSKYCWDCSGMIKGVIWGYPKKGKYVSNGLSDINSGTMIKRCTEVRSNVNSAKLGELLWMEGHVGVSLGNGYHIECTPAFDGGIQIIKSSKRKWLKCGKMPWIEYSEDVKKVSVTDIAKMVVRGDFGNGHTTRKVAIEKKYPYINYDEVRNRVNEYYRKGNKW